MRRYFGLLLSTVLLAFAVPTHAQPGNVGIVLLHGKQDREPYHFSALAQQLVAAGYVVFTPEMPWSRNRIYDASFEDALMEIDKAIEGIKKEGVSKVVVGGLSMGGNVALGYAARRDNLAGLLVLAPGHYPELKGFAKMTADSVARAKEMVASGRGDTVDSFADTNMGKNFSSRATAKTYLSYFDPQGPAVMPANAAAIRSSIPILWVVGSKDPLTRPRGYAFGKAPGHPKSKFVTVEAGHLDTPQAASNEVLTWLQDLAQ